MTEGVSAKPIVEILRPESYLALIKNSVGSLMWQQMFASVNGTQQDIMRNGDLSCAFFVSSILKLCDLVPQLSVTVYGLVKNLEALQWPKVTDPQAGDIIVWESMADERGDVHAHIGFFIGDTQAISNDSKIGSPQLHHWTFNDTRNVTTMFRPLWEPQSS